MADSNSGGIKLEKFLTAEAMITPGIAGSTVMTITNVLAPTFAWPQAWIALGLSFMVGLVLVRGDGGVIPKSVFYVLNSLVVFTVAFGTNSTALALKQTPSVALALVGSAYAQDAAVDLVALQTEIDQLGAQYDSLTAAIETARQNNASAAEIDALVAQQQAIDAQRAGAIARLVSSVQSVQTQQADQFFSPWKF